ncbi:MAG: response regulator [Chloroflexi bacterium]|nr:response regulator [Chloroflexota bacterium]
MPTVLVIDDDPFLRRLLAATFRGLQLLTAADGWQGLALVRRHRPAVIVLDVTMPGVSGLEVCRALRSDPELAATPVILLTGNTDPETQEAARLAGATAFLTKPFRPMALLSLIDRYTGGFSFSPSHDPQPTWGAAAAAQ